MLLQEEHFWHQRDAKLRELASTLSGTPRDSAPAEEPIQGADASRCAHVSACFVLTWCCSCTLSDTQPDVLKMLRLPCSQDGAGSVPGPQSGCKDSPISVVSATFAALSPVINPGVAVSRWSQLHHAHAPCSLQTTKPYRSLYWICYPRQMYKTGRDSSSSLKYRR